ncbi:MAG: hypothetical protein U0263_01570 [Polyangiaceae bacterium]
MPKRPLSLPEELAAKVDALWKDETKAIRDEPTYELLLFLEALVTDREWFDESHGPNSAQVLAAVARAYRTSGGPKSGLGFEFSSRFAGQRALRWSPLDVSRTAFLWPAARFLADVAAALERGDDLTAPPWPSRVLELQYVLLPTWPGRAARELLAQLASRAGVVRSLKDGWSDAKHDALSGWLQRVNPVRTYHPSANTDREAAEFALGYVLGSLKKEASRHMMKAKAAELCLSNGQLKRFRKEYGRDPKSVKEAGEYAAEMRQRKLRQGSGLSEKAVAEALGRSRSAVAHARSKLNLDVRRDADGRYSYTRDDVRALHEHFKQSKRPKRRRTQRRH